jgi:hypothetical protein
MKSKPRIEFMDAFNTAFHPQRRLLVGADGISLEDFLSKPVSYWVRPAEFPATI